MTNFWKTITFWKACAIVWVVGLSLGFLGVGAQPFCYRGAGAFGDRLSKGFSVQGIENPQGWVITQGAVEGTAATSHGGFKIVALVFGVLTGYYVGYSVHYALYVPACPNFGQAPWLGR
jgi:hypothetical protein